MDGRHLYFYQDTKSLDCGGSMTTMTTWQRIKSGQICLPEWLFYSKAFQSLSAWLGIEWEIHP